jgi:hypothetical protein
MVVHQLRNSNDVELSDETWLTNKLMNKLMNGNDVTGQQLEE